MNLEDMSSFLLLLLLELFIAMVIYFLRFFLFIDNNKNFYQNYRGKSFKMTKLIYQQEKTDKF